MIYRDGSVHDGRSVDYGGAHCSGHNARSIGVCYVGGLENKNVPYNQLKAKDTRTEEQRASLLSLLMDLRKLYPEALIMGHRDTSPDLNGDGIVEPWEWVKDCPSFDAMKEYAKV
jgi:N-acetyl-anhydromuramyl-L-alanine amidase AmpD